MNTETNNNVIKLLKSAIYYQLLKRKIKCEEKSDYISTEILDFYTKEDCCYIVTSSLLDIKFYKEFRFNKITNDTSSEKLTKLAITIVEKALSITIGDLLKN